MSTLIIDPRRQKQTIDFYGLQYGKIAPTDVDAVIELNDKAWIVYEVKYGNKDVPFGQKLCIERMIRDFGSAGKSAIAIILEHDVADPDESIMIAKCIVREIYQGNKWIQQDRTETAKQITDRFMGSIGRV